MEEKSYRGLYCPFISSIRTYIIIIIIIIYSNLFTCIYPGLIARPLTRFKLHDHVVAQVDKHVGHEHDEEVVRGSITVTAGLYCIVDTEKEVEDAGDCKEYEKRSNLRNLLALHSIENLF